MRSVCTPFLRRQPGRGRAASRAPFAARPRGSAGALSLNTPARPLRCASANPGAAPTPPPPGLFSWHQPSVSHFSPEEPAGRSESPGKRPPDYPSARPREPRPPNASVSGAACWPGRRSSKRLGEAAAARPPASLPARPPASQPASHPRTRAAVARRREGSRAPGLRAAGGRCDPSRPHCAAGGQVGGRGKWGLRESVRQPKGAGEAGAVLRRVGGGPERGGPSRARRPPP